MVHFIQEKRRRTFARVYIYCSLRSNLNFAIATVRFLLLDTCYKYIRSYKLFVGIDLALTLLVTLIVAQRVLYLI